MRAQEVIAKIRAIFVYVIEMLKDIFGITDEAEDETTTA